MILLLTTAFLSLIVINVRASSDVIYTFEQLIIHNTNDPTYSDDWNLRNASSITQTYNATYNMDDTSFVDIDQSTDGSLVEYVDSYYGHDKVLNLTDVSDGGTFNVRNYISNDPTSGSIEFWYLSDDTDVSTYKYCLLSAYDDIGAISFQVSFCYNQGNQISYNNGSWNIIYNNLQEFIWYHVRIDIDYTSDTYEFFLNGISLESGINFQNTGTNIEGIYINGRGNSLGNVPYSHYFDGFGYSWNTYYNIGDNIVPLFETDETIMEVDKYEFRFEGINDYYDVNDDNPSGWTDIEDGGDHVNIVVDVNDALDRSIQFKDDLVVAQDIGIEKNFDVENGNVNISWSFDPTMSNPDSIFMLRVGSYDKAYIVGINASYGSVPAASDIDLYYFDGTNSILLTTNLLDYVHDFNLFIDYSSDTCVLEHIKNGNFDNRYFFPLIETGKNGLGEINFTSETTSGSYWNTIYIDNVGIYVNGTSITTEFAYLVSDNFNAPSLEWNMERYNLFSFEAIGQIGIYVLATIYLPDTSTISLIRASTRCLGSEIMVNTHDITLLGSHLVPLAKLLFIVYNSNLSTSINEINIEGFRINDGSIVLYPLHYEANVNTSESYFYVDSSNKLRFNLIANDNSTEWIETRFFLFYETTENRSVSFKSNIDGISKGILDLLYWGGEHTQIYFPYYERTTTLKLPQDRIIYYLSIKITDLDITYYDICEGYITNVKLLYTPEGIAGAKLISVDIANLIMIIIPLIILIAPSLAISIKFGRKAILPMFMVMTIVCLATNLIPIWLFFIMILGSGALLITEYLRGNDD